MKKGDIMYCVNIKDLRQTMKDLTAAGYHAVRDSDDNFSIRITGVPETQYLVEARSENTGVQKAYCDTLEEAEDAAAEFGSVYQWVQIMKGYAGEWEIVSQSW